MEGLGSGIIGSLIASALWCLGLKLYLGSKDSRGIKKVARLVRDSYEGGIINFFPTRQVYVQHKDHGTVSDYIARCNTKLMYIGYWMAHGTEMGNVCDVLRKMVNQDREVILILMNPDNEPLIKQMADYLKMDYEEMSQRLKTSIDKFYKVKNNLPGDIRNHLEIRVHNLPLNSSAFMIDYDNEKEMKILMDYKIYGYEREKSYGIEFADKKKSVTQNLYSSFLRIYKEKSQEYRHENEEK